MAHVLICILSKFIAGILFHPFNFRYMGPGLGHLWGLGVESGQLEEIAGAKHGRLAFLAFDFKSVVLKGQRMSPEWALATMRRG